LAHDAESEWLAQTYQPNVRQFTVRAVLAGMAIGAVMCVSNMYVFFRAGWSMGVTVTAAILAFALFRGLHATRLTREPLSALENNTLTTVASGAGYMTGGGNMAAFGALIMIGATQPPIVAMIAWFAVIAALGVFVAIPIKRQLINREALAFPTGTATAETIRTIHAEPAGGRSSGSSQAYALGGAALVTGVIAWFRAAKASWMPFNLPETIHLPFSIAGRKAADWTLSLTTDLLMVGAGALMSFRTAWSLLLGGVLTYAVLAPALLEQGLIAAVNYKSIMAWTVWPGAAMLVSSGLTSFLLDWRSLARTFGGLGAMFGRKQREAPHPIEAVECPAWWFPAGFAVLAPIVIVLMVWLFQIPWWAGLVALPLAVIMGFIAARVTGETDVTPTKAFGPVTQMVFGAITPGNMSGNIMSANVTGGVGLHAADLLTTLKTGWLLGGNPRVQFYAQLFGVVVGAAVIVPAFHLLIDDPAKLGGTEWPAPGAVVWKTVSQACAAGLDSIGPAARMAALAGLLLGIVLALLEKFAPPRAKPFVPSPSGLGLSMVLPGMNVIMMFLGGLAAELLRKIWPELALRFVVPAASGIIAGESLMGVTIIVLKLTGALNA